MSGQRAATGVRAIGITEILRLDVRTHASFDRYSRVALTEPGFCLLRTSRAFSRKTYPYSGCLILLAAELHLGGTTLLEHLAEVGRGPCSCGRLEETIRHPGLSCLFELV